MMSNTRQQSTTKTTIVQETHVNISQETDIQGKLAERGILEVAHQAGWIAQGKRWHYPIYGPAGEIIATRSKAASKNDSKKYAWHPSKPKNPDVDFYILPGTVDAIKQADGVCYLANGEPALLAFHAAGIENVIATTGSENSIPESTHDYFERIGIRALINIADNDDTGRKGAAKWRDTLQDTEIQYLALQWGSDKRGADANDIWIECGFDSDAFSKRLKQLDVLLLPAREKPVEFTYDASNYDNTPQGLIDALMSVMGISGKRFNAKGWTQKSFRNPLREDRHPSASFNRMSGVLYDHATDESLSPTELADALGIDWKPYYPKRERTHKQVSKHKLDDAPDTQQSKPMSAWASPVTMPSYTASVQVQQPYISTLDERHFSARTLRIKSPLATGKTELFKQVIVWFEREHGRQPTVLLQTHSQALVNNAAARLGIQSYQDVPSNADTRKYIDAMPQVAITYDSLHLVSGRKFDLVFIDEFEQNMAHVFSGTMNGTQAKRAFETLTGILNTAQQVIIADAHLTDNLLPFLTKYRGADGMVSVENTYRQQWGRLTLWKDSAALIERALHQAHTAQHPIVITANSRKQTELLRLIFEEEIGTDNVFVVNGWNSSHSTRRAFLNDINRQITNKRVVICSPTIGTGIDIQARVSAVYGIFSRDTWGSATTIMQQMMRFRHADTRHLYVQAVFDGDEETDATARYNHHLARVRGTASVAKFEQGNISSDDDTHRALLMIESIQKSARAKQRNNLLSYTVAYAQDEGFTLAYNEQQSDTMRDRLKVAREALVDEQRDSVLNLPAISSDDYDTLLQNGLVDRKTHYQNLRWKIEQTAGQAINTELYGLLCTSRRRRDFNRFVDLHETIATLQERDRGQAKYDDLITKRGHYTRVQQLITDGLQAVFGNEWHLCVDELTADEIAERLKPYLETHLKEIQLYIDKRTDLSIDPVALLRRLLKRVSLILSYRRVRRDNKLIYVYSLDREHYARMRDLASTALAARHKEGVPNHVTNTSDKRVLEQKTPVSPISPLGAAKDTASKGVYMQTSTGETIHIPF